jgi:hypothetical protein
VRTETKTLDWFLNDPRTRKWIVHCSRCGTYGRKPESPGNIPKKNFEAMFARMRLDPETGACEQCMAAKPTCERSRATSNTSLERTRER